MSILNEEQIQYGFGHTKNFQIEKMVVEVSEYSGEKELIIQCTQLDDDKYKAKDKKRILNEWIDFLTNNSEAFTKLQFSSRMPQDLFNAVCHQKNLKWLYIKWGVYPDISKISDLKNLQYLHIGSGASVFNIEPISKLENLVALAIENFQKINDYSSISKLKNLESLCIEGDFASPRYVHINSLDFLAKMTQLRYFCLRTAKVISKDYSPILELTNLEYLTLPPHKEIKLLYNEFIKLPKLKYGLLLENPSRYKE